MSPLFQKAVAYATILNRLAGRRVAHVTAYRVGRRHEPTRYRYEVCTCPGTGGRPDIARRPLGMRPVTDAAAGRPTVLRRRPAGPPLAHTIGGTLRRAAFAVSSSRPGVVTRVMID